MFVWRVGMRVFALKARWKSPVAEARPRPGPEGEKTEGAAPAGGDQWTSKPTTALAALAVEPASTVPASATLVVPKARRTQGRLVKAQ